VHLVADTFLVSEFVDNANLVSTPDGLLSLEVQSEAVQFAFDDVLESAAIATSVGFPSPGLNAPGDLRDTLRFTTPAGSQVVGATMSSGSATRIITNGTNCDATVTVGIVDSLGTAVVTFAANVAVTAGNAVMETVNLNGASFVQFVEIIPSATFAVGCTVTGGNVSTSIAFTQATLASVDLDNLSESFTIEEAEELQRTAFEFDELEDAINQSTLNSATIDIIVTNTADAPVVLNDVTIGAVQLDAAGMLKRDSTRADSLDFETDGSGTPIQVRIADAGQTTLAVPRNGTTSVSVPAAALVDRVTHLLLDGDRVAFVATGSADADDGSSGRIVMGDSVIMGYTVTVGLDFTIPVAGIQFDVDNTVTNGVELDTAEIDDIVARIVSIGGVARVENFTAFGVEVSAALAPDSLDAAVDVFTQPGGFQLTPITVSAPAVSAAGVPLGSSIDSVSVSITAQEARVILGDKFTAGIRLRLLPGTGGSGRGAIRPNDKIVVTAAVNISIQRGSQ